jgi:hypothetical protein
MASTTVDDDVSFLTSEESWRGSDGGPNHRWLKDDLGRSAWSVRENREQRARAMSGGSRRAARSTVASLDALCCCARLRLGRPTRASPSCPACHSFASRPSLPLSSISLPLPTRFRRHAPLVPVVCPRPAGLRDLGPSRPGRREAHHEPLLPHRPSTSPSSGLGRPKAVSSGLTRLLGPLPLPDRSPRPSRRVRRSFRRCRSAATLLC